MVCCAAIILDGRVVLVSLCGGSWLFGCVCCLHSRFLFLACSYCFCCGCCSFYCSLDGSCFCSCHVLFLVILPFFLFFRFVLVRSTPSIHSSVDVRLFPMFVSLLCEGLANLTQPILSCLCLVCCIKRVLRKSPGQLFVWLLVS